MKILKELITRGTCNVTQIVDILGIPQSTVSQHLSFSDRRLLPQKCEGVKRQF
ncbi:MULTISPECIES: helix-turn-helix transcriptional regulator [Bacillus]|uniref:ArsR/SmtB family transcription factor n=1 Tax=Bacillus TaxID=1386 RepID=UPI0008FE3EF8|nr:MULTISPECIES: ArsR family transcriptional regulator [Bacillus]MED1512764.1 ArsR family transcriptional regulator [Bacillus proteolyticus]